MRPPNPVELNQANRAFEYFVENALYNHPLQTYWSNTESQELVIAAIVFGIQWQKAHKTNTKGYVERTSFNTI